MLLLQPRAVAAPALRGRPPPHRPRPRPRRRLVPPPVAAASGSVAVSSDEDAFTRCSGYLFEEGAATESQLPTAYDLPGIAAVYRRRPFLVLRRSLQIGTSFGRWFALRFLDRVNERADDMFEVRTSRCACFLIGPAHACCLIELLAVLFGSPMIWCWCSFGRLSSGGYCWNSARYVLFPNACLFMCASRMI
jgi:aarF domain-containing kinase